MKPVGSPTSWTKFAPEGSLADTVNKMSNANVNYKGKAYGGGSGVKPTHGGKDLSQNATNSMGKFSNTENSPSSTCMGEGKRGSKRY